MNYYNEWDKYAAGWLRNLQTAGHIPQGQVDERSIRDVTPEEVKGATQAHFFAGIGGWPYALKLAGWPDDLPVWTGSCPCQPFSCAGQRKGAEDERHLWPEFRRLIAECRPAVVFGEQVASKDGRQWLDGVRADLEALGYAVGAADLCAAGVGAPHIRQRLYWVADSTGRIVRDGELQSGGEHRLLAANGGAGERTRRAVGDEEVQDSWLADKQTDRRKQECSEPEGVDQRSEEKGRSAGSRLRGAPDGMAHAECNSRGSRRAPVESSEGVGEEEAGASVELGRRGNPRWLGDPSQPGLEGRDLEGNGAHERTAWTPSVAIPCIDGKARRIEPGTFPLAHGVPDRVGKLRAYGNAIVPQVAAEFIRAFMETRVA